MNYITLTRNGQRRQLANEVQINNGRALKRLLAAGWVVEEAPEPTTEPSPRWPRSKIEANPLVSILMPAHPPMAPYIGRAIASCQDQTHTNWELCIALDGPCPKLVPILAGLAAYDRRVRWAEGSVGGYAVAMNRALAMARGLVIARLDADDAQHPQRLEAQLDSLRAGGHIASCGMTWIGQDDSELRVWPPLPMDAAAYATTGCDVCGASVVTTRRVWDVVGGFSTDSAISYSADVDWNLRTLKAEFDWSYVERPWYYQRRHPAQMSADRDKQQGIARALRERY